MKVKKRRCSICFILRFIESNRIERLSSKMSSPWNFKLTDFESALEMEKRSCYNFRKKIKKIVATLWAELFSQNRNKNELRRNFGIAHFSYIVISKEMTANQLKAQLHNENPLIGLVNEMRTNQKCMLKYSIHSDVSCKSKSHLDMFISIKKMK